MLLHFCVRCGWGREITLALCPQLYLQGHPPAIRTWVRTQCPTRSSEQLSGQCASTIGHRAVAGDTAGADGQNWRVSSLAVTSNSREWASGGLRRVSLGAAENTEDGSLLARRWGWLWAQDGASWFSVIHCQNRNFRVPVAWDLHR